jgi:hypothetical protein
MTIEFVGSGFLSPPQAAKRPETKKQPAAHSRSARPALQAATWA